MDLIISVCCKTTNIQNHKEPQRKSQRDACSSGTLNDRHLDYTTAFKRQQKSFNLQHNGYILLLSIYWQLKLNFSAAFWKRYVASGKTSNAKKIIDAKGYGI